MTDHVLPPLACVLPSSLPHRSRLHAIADLLGVSAEAFHRAKDGQTFHAGEDGTRWLLARCAAGALVVRRTRCHPVGAPTTEMDLATFLSRHAGEPEHHALTALIDALLLAQIGH